MCELVFPQSICAILLVMNLQILSLDFKYYTSVLVYSAADESKVSLRYTKFPELHQCELSEYNRQISESLLFGMFEMNLPPLLSNAHLIFDFQ